MFCPLYNYLPGIGTHTITVSSPRGEYSAHWRAAETCSQCISICTFHQVHNYTAGWTEAQTKLESYPRILHMARSGIKLCSIWGPTLYHCATGLGTYGKTEVVISRFYIHWVFTASKLYALYTLGQVYAIKHSLGWLSSQTLQWPDRQNRIRKVRLNCTTCTMCVYWIRAW